MNVHRHWSHTDSISVMGYTQCCGQTFPEFEAEIWETWASDWPESSPTVRSVFSSAKPQNYFLITLQLSPRNHLNTTTVQSLHTFQRWRSGGTPHSCYLYEHNTPCWLAAFHGRALLVLVFVQVNMLHDKIHRDAFSLVTRSEEKNMEPSSGNSLLTARQTDKHSP